MQEFFANNRDRSINFDELTKKFGMNRETVEEMLFKELEHSTELFVVGNGQYMFSKDKDLVSFEIFKTVAPNITMEEWTTNHNDLPRLMYLSRRREIGKYNETARSVMGL